jgi:hypothetical protein
MPENYFNVEVLRNENGNPVTKFEFESNVLSPTDSMGREIWWEDAGRPETTDK